MISELNTVKTILERGKTILYPTDTVWGIGCDATDENAVADIYKIKQREASKSLIILVNSLEMLSDYISNIPLNVIEILHNASEPTTIIYNNPKGLAKNCIADDDTVAVRIVKNDFCKQLIHQFGKPIVSTSANISGNPTPKSFKEIEPSILESVDYVVDLHRDKISDKSSTILKVETNGDLIVLRK